MLDDIKVSQQEIMTDFLLLLINIYLMFIEKEGHVSVYFWLYIIWTPSLCLENLPPYWEEAGL